VHREVLFAAVSVYITRQDTHHEPASVLWPEHLDDIGGNELARQANIDSLTG
jgi:hypothetical protein